MIKLVSFLLLLIPAVSFGQCVKCNSLTEAKKDPAKVISIIINSNVHNLTLEKIPENIDIYTNLEQLYLTDHGFTSVPKAIGNLTKLKTLSLAGNNLETLPEEIFQLKGLKELILFSNSFSDEYKEQLKKKVKELLPGTKLMID